MAKVKATLVIDLLNKASAGLSALKSQLLAITASVAGVTAFIVDSLKAYAEQESAVSKLNTALKNQGIVSKQVTNDLVNYAGELQKVTAFSDETIVESQALLVTFGIVGDQLKATTKSALDLSVGLGIDLRTATMILGKAFTGEVGTLSRYGIKISELIPVGQRFSEVQRLIAERFGGAAKAQAETFAGKLAILNNQFGELKESIGALLIGPATKLTVWIKGLVVDLQNIVSWWARAFPTEPIRKTQEEIDFLASKINIMRLSLGYEVAKRTGGWKLLNDQLAEATARMQALKDVENKTAVGAPGKLPGATEEEQTLLDQSQKRIDLLTYTNDQIALKETMHMQSELMKQKKFGEATRLQEASSANMIAGIRMNLWNTLATVGAAKSKELFFVAKGLAIAEATLNAWRGYVYALANPPGPPFSIPQAKLALGLGLSGVAAMAAQTFVGMARGGMVLPTTSGTLAQIGEAGKPEVVIPLDDSRTTEKLRETLGGSTTVIIQAGTIIADDYSVEQFAQLIDEKLFSLKRNRGAVS